MNFRVVGLAVGARVRVLVRAMAMRWHKEYPMAVSLWPLPLQNTIKFPLALWIFAQFIF